MSVSRRLACSDVRERGQVIVMFALLLPVFLAMSGAVVGIGNWYTHAKHLQTKADAGAFAGGTEWEYPCGSQIDARIEASARLYAGSNNPQVGGVPDTSIHTVLNGSAWYDDDSNPSPVERNSPLNASVCAANVLDVKVTEDNSFPLASLIPLFPDIKRKARVEIQETSSVSGLLPIAVRAPEPVSAAAVFYNESNGNVLGVKYLVKNNSIFGMPGGLQGWSSYNTEDPSTWASFTPSGSTGVLLAISPRGACNTSLPSPNTKIVTASAPCFEDAGFTTVDQLCNQGSTTQIVNCYYATGSWPTQTVQPGLHFIRGYNPSPNPGNGAPALESSWLENVSCLVSGVSGTGYFNAHATNACQARMHLVVNVGTLNGEYGAPGPPGNGPLQAQDVEVRYSLVANDGGTVVCANYGANCDLTSSGNGPTMTYSTQGGGTSPHLPLTAKEKGHAVAIQIRLKRVANSSDPDCANTNFNNNCRWFYTGSGNPFGTSVPPTNAQILASPVQRAFRGSSVISGSAQWLRLTTDRNCDGTPEYVDLEAASQPNTSNSCYFVDVGLKGGLAQTASEEPILFNDGIGSSQLGTLDCDPSIPQGQELIDGIKNGCNLSYAAHPFDWSPLCPSTSNLFTTPNPGAPWDDGRWPPIRCIKTRTTSAANQMERGFDGRFFGNENTNSCPPTAPTYVKGRNYWDKDTNNGYTGTPPLGFAEGTHNTHFDPQDPRIVTIFLTTPEGFTASGQNTYPITGFITIYVTGYGRIAGNGSIQIDDPCPGNAPPSELDLSGGNAGGYTIWGHILKRAIPAGSGTPSGVLCNPANFTPCIAVLVE